MRDGSHFIPNPRTCPVPMWISYRGLPIWAYWPFQELFQARSILMRCDVTQVVLRARRICRQRTYHCLIWGSVKKDEWVAFVLLVHATYSSTPPVVFQLSRSTAMTCIITIHVALNSASWRLVRKVPCADSTRYCRGCHHHIPMWLKAVLTLRLRFLASFRR